MPSSTTTTRRSSSGMPAFSRVVLWTIVVLYLSQLVMSRSIPLHLSSHLREKRSGISDQRLAEIEALIAMAKAGRHHYGGGKLHGNSPFGGYNGVNPADVG
ncbi:hypothetical protein BV898_13934 [Hypsibius exemplaris]|uniref:Uncharacterized protein n=1 Tax=Hypsibius exemplaris TaxID=2072580 RepID=A0A1W0W955_HYPEX|nr:hypothetical protein BV898_13934 [Hypsibius exemplaris]